MSLDRPLWDHQKEAITRARGKTHFGLFFEAGTGKTRTTIEILREKCTSEGRLLRTLILCPPIVVENWKREIVMFSKILAASIIPLVGPGKKRLKVFKEESATPRIFITNYEALLMTDLFEKLLEWDIECLILDESHKCKNISSKRTKKAVALADSARFRYILSGTPILNSPMDIFSQFRILDRGVSFSKNFFAFRANFFYDKNAHMPRHVYFPDWKIKPDSLDRMNIIIHEKAMRVKKQECLDLPPLVRQTLHVELTPLQAKIYKSMKEEFIAYIGDKACVATLAITKALRLQQIVSGYIKLEDDLEIHLEKTPRQETLKELLEEITPHSKVLVWAVFRENYEQIRNVCTELGIAYVEIHGEVPTPKRQALVDAFNTDPSIRVFIGHPGSGGIGINLIAASYSIFFSRSFSLEYDIQAEARNYRGGSEIHPKITRIDLVAKDTIDEIILQALSDKVEVSEHMLKNIARQL